MPVAFNMDVHIPHAITGTEYVIDGGTIPTD
jgi:hypothetical protein